MARFQILIGIRASAARKGIELKGKQDRDAQVYADRNMIHSVLQNLISNAIKFTELCKEMIEKHEGRIWAESEPGRGSAFYFTLPCATPTAKEE